MSSYFSIHSVVGQEIAIQFIERYIANSQSIPPLLIFHGPSGVGKWTLAERFVFHILCKNGNGCSQCESCRLFLSNQHPDFIQFPEGEKILIGKDDDKKLDEYTVRWLLAKRIPYVPHISKYRIILIPEASLFTDEAESALLKTLEEPPHHTRFIFLTDDLLKLKQTILSRAVCIPFQYLSQESILKILSNNPHISIEKYFGGSVSPLKVPSNILHLIENRAKESIYDSLSLLEFESWVKNYKDSHPEWDSDFNYFDFIDAVLLILLHTYSSSELPNKYFCLEEIFTAKQLMKRDIANLENYILSKLFNSLINL
jgi:DNA polymerase III subunit gamma/tau